MGAIQEILELVKDLKNNDYLDADEVRGQLNLKFGRNSISKKAGHAILQFPVLTTDVISVQDLTMINKALERQYATFTAIAMGLDDHLEDGEVKGDYVRRFHQNIGTRDQLRINAGYFDEDAKLLLTQGNKQALRPYSEDLRMNSLNSMTDRNNRNHYILGETNIRKTLSEADDGLKVRDKSQYTNHLLNNDVKKANELVPTTLDISVFMSNGKSTVQSNILLGIKAISHLVESEEMIYNVSKAIEEKRSLFRFFQWTTGEIEFFKDYLFMIDRIKREATGRRDDSHWWRSLKRRSAEDKLRRMTFSKKEVLPNATILITMDEVEYIANNYNIDLLGNTAAVRTLMEVFFLLGFVIVDPAAELAYFFFDGQTTFQTFSYSSLERENTSTSEVKSIVSLMNKA
jgi:hypothetical protein